MFFLFWCHQPSVTWLISLHRAKAPHLHHILGWEGLCYCLPCEQDQQHTCQDGNAHRYASPCLRLWEVGVAFEGSGYRVGHYLLLSCHSSPPWGLSWDVWGLWERGCKRLVCLSSAFSRSLLKHKAYVHFPPTEPQIHPSFPSQPFSGPILRKCLAGIIFHGGHWETFGDNVLLSQ